MKVNPNLSVTKNELLKLKLRPKLEVEKKVKMELKKLTMHFEDLLILQSIVLHQHHSY